MEWLSNISFCLYFSLWQLCVFLSFYACFVAWNCSMLQVFRLLSFSVAVTCIKCLWCTLYFALTPVSVTSAIDCKEWLLYGGLLCVEWYVNSCLLIRLLVHIEDIEFVVVGDVAGSPRHSLALLMRSWTCPNLHHRCVSSVCLHSLRQQIN